MSSFLKAARQLVKYLAFIIVVCGALMLVRMQVQASHIDAEITRGAGPATQEQDAQTHREYWAKFDLGARVVVIGSLALSLTLTSKRACQVGCVTIGLGAILLLPSFAGIHSGYAGAAAFASVLGVFRAGMLLLIVGGLRLGFITLGRRTA